MGLRDKVAKSVQKALQSVGDLADTVTYVSVTLGVYDPATDTQVRTTVAHPVTAAQVALTEAEVDYFAGNRNTVKLLIAGLDLPTQVQPEDYVMIGSVRWEIKRIKGVPGKSLHIIFLQEP
jgi:hypothetical protein